MLNIKYYNSKVRYLDNTLSHPSLSPVPSFSDTERVGLDNLAIKDRPEANSNKPTRQRTSICYMDGCIQTFSRCFQPSLLPNRLTGTYHSLWRRRMWLCTRDRDRSGHKAPPRPTLPQQMLHAPPVPLIHSHYLPLHTVCYPLSPIQSRKYPLGRAGRIHHGNCADCMSVGGEVP